MTAGTGPLWAADAIGRVTALAATAPHPLRNRLAAALERIARSNGGDSLGSALGSPSATPFLRLMDAYASDVGIAADDPRLADLGEGAVALYAEVRVQDDLVDEPDLVDRGFVYAMSAFGAASAAAFARALGAGSPAFFGFRGEVLRDLAAAAAFELDVVRAAGEEGSDVDWLGDKMLPLAIPLGAVAIAGGRERDLAATRAFTRRLGRGLQLVNDALNVQEDHVAGRRTPVLGWLYAGGRIGPGDPPGAIRAMLNADAAMDRTIALARRAVFEALETALAMSAPRLAAITSERATLVESTRARLLALSLGGGVV